MRWRKTTGAGGKRKKDAFIYVFIFIKVLTMKIKGVI